jgi:hypothetical protein
VRLTLSLSKSLCASAEYSIVPGGSSPMCTDRRTDLLTAAMACVGHTLLGHENGGTFNCQMPTTIFPMTDPFWWCHMVHCLSVEGAPVAMAARGAISRSSSADSSSDEYSAVYKNEPCPKDVPNIKM